MLPKPVTALALSALVCIASFTASSAVAAPSTSSDSNLTSTAAPAKGAHHTKKKGLSKAHKKSAQLASLHSAEPKSSPRLASKEPPKLAASLSTRLDLKNAADKPAHSAPAHKTTIAATGKEVFIGGPTGHKHAAESNISGKASGKLAVNGSASVHGSRSGVMAKSARSPSRPASASSRAEVVEPGEGDHPVRVALRTSSVTTVAPSAPCFHDPIEFVRGAETDRFPVTRCDGAAAPLASERLSVLVRPDNAELPKSIAELAKVKGPEIAPGVRRVDPGLLSRVQLIADHFAKPGMPERISIVSGYRPGSKGSFHASAQALDFHLEGVPNEALVDFCKTLENTGCGYYPNSSFVHVDVRSPGTGHVAWIDTSGPGEAPHYVASWPPPPDAEVKTAKEDDDMVNPYSDSLPPLPGQSQVKDELRAPAASVNAPLKLKDWE